LSILKFFPERQDEFRGKYEIHLVILSRRKIKFMMLDCIFEELGHTAEIGLRVQAKSSQGLFACAALGMFGLLNAPPDPSVPAIEYDLVVESIDVESLLVDWLNELLYLFETTGALYNQYEIKQWTPTHLTATVAGVPPAHPPAIHIKAATYHQLQVAQSDRGWMAQIYFDI
jgi:SHS2 domain-containing protein